MKLVRKKKDNHKETKGVIKKPKIKLPSWKILIVDDETDIHSMTRLALDDFEFAGKKLQIFQAMSGIEARDILEKEPEIAVALIDVVMESDDAGLQLVDFIRNKLKYPLIRLIIRTGQPGMAPEKEVIERYDIDDYKDKTELTAEKLYTTMRIALKSYRDLSILDINRNALTKILDAAPELYHPQSINQFFNGVLSQIIGLCNLGETGLISTISNGIVVTADDHKVAIQAGTGRFINPTENLGMEKIVKNCSAHILETTSHEPLPEGAILIPLKVHNKPIGFIYLEDAQHLNEANQKLIYIMVNQCASALENLELYHDLKKANQQTSQMLNIAEQAREMAEAASRAKSTFLAKMSHELRTPLNAIIGYSDIIHEDAADSNCGVILPDLEKVQTAGKQLLAIISDILDISKIEADKLELYLSEFAVSRIIDEVVMTIQPIMTSKDNCINVECCGELGLIHTDYNKLRQILLNLLNNATKFTEKGSITFTITRFKNFSISEQKEQLQKNISPMRLSECENSDYLSFEVIDTGIGIAPDKLKTIFESFVQGDDSSTREFEGTGLGLPIIKHFCQALGGKISVNSTLGEGSIFTVQLPAQIDSYKENNE
ncbi:DUF3369 domain-containing protein [Candidatus Parabeggiatoa sp. HSG14]|uniref:sensor histidine kinase n=1 Tax=Candidatus Parabeggiatoa sp. HSG14 TaxID=3055593 RepID=UPI0025A71AAC|nr:DUF3369 domain-containing protein [Thiotrichales bacterium HSG14]